MLRTFHCIFSDPASHDTVASLSNDVGEPGDNFYVVELGEFEIFVSKNKKKARKVATIQSGSSFGELALMYNAPRAATVTV